MTDKHNIELSRRKILAGLGTIGVASAGAGLGTSAYFTDTESFEGNVLTAGELNLAVDYDSSYNSDGAASNQGTINAFVDGESKVIFTLDDVKPGDSATVDFCFQSVDNPSYIWFCGQLEENAQNSINDPEQTALDNLGYQNESGNGGINQTQFQTEVVGNNSKIYDMGDWGGQLAQSMDVTLGYSQSGGSSGGADSQSTMDVTIAEGTLGEVMGGGLSLPLDALSSYPSGYQAADSGNQTAFNATDDVGENEDFASPCLQMTLSVPETTGNIIQSDSVAFGIVFHAQQARHNTGSESPCGFPEDGDDDDTNGELPQ